MAQPTMVRVDPDELQKLVVRAGSLASDIRVRYSAIDKSLDDLKESWKGKNRTLFYSQVEDVREERNRAVDALEAFCSEGLPIASREYAELESIIQAAVQKLKNGQL